VVSNERGWRRRGVVSHRDQLPGNISSRGVRRRAIRKSGNALDLRRRPGDAHWVANSARISPRPIWITRLAASK
jgi:hypothetical protein